MPDDKPLTVEEVAEATQGKPRNCPNMDKNRKTHKCRRCWREVPYLNC